MTTLTADPGADLEGLLDGDTERTCEMYAIYVDIGHRRECARPAAYILHLRLTCGHGGPTTAFVCHECVGEVLDGASVFGCWLDACMIAARITHLERLR